MQCAYCEEPIEGRPVVRDDQTFCSLVCAQRASEFEPDDYDRLMADLTEPTAADSGAVNGDADDDTGE